MGKLVSEWNKLVSEASDKPEMVDMSVAVSAFMAQKDQEELVCRSFGTHKKDVLMYDQKTIQIASSLTSTLLKHHVGPRLETILDKESKISHEMLAAQIEGRLGSGEGSNAKGPDMKVWNKGKGLEKVRTMVSLTLDQG